MPLSAGLYYFFHDGGKASLPPLVLLHGPGGDHLAWPAGIRRQPGLNIYALDLPGHGRSPGPGRQSAADYARAIVDFMDAVGLWKAVFIGHSLGGAVALSLALGSPQRCAALVLVSSGARLPIPPQVLENAASPSTFPFAVQAMHALSCSSLTPPRLSDQALARLLALRPTLFHGDLLACDRFDASASLGSVPVPALVICGTHDRLTPLHLSTSLAASIPGAALQTIEESGHLVMLEQPDRLAKLFAVFVRSIPYSPGA